MEPSNGVVAPIASYQPAGLPYRRDASLRLRYRQKLPGRHVMQLLHDARRPFDANRIDTRSVRQAELGVQGLLVRFSLAAGDGPELPATLATVESLHTHLSPDCGPVGHGAHQLHVQPGVAVAIVVIEKRRLWRGSKCPLRDKEIQEAVVVVVAPAGALALGDEIRHQPAVGHFRERAVAVVVVEEVVGVWWTQVGIGIAVTNGHEEIDEAIVVVFGPRATGEDRVRGNAFLYGRNVGNAGEGAGRRCRSIVVVEGIL